MLIDVNSIVEEQMLPKGCTCDLCSKWTVKFGGIFPHRSDCQNLNEKLMGVESFLFPVHDAFADVTSDNSLRIGNRSQGT
jgi:hypothetical protein